MSRCGASDTHSTNLRMRSIEEINYPARNANYYAICSSFIHHKNRVTGEQAVLNLDCLYQVC